MKNLFSAAALLLLCASSATAFPPRDGYYEGNLMGIRVGFHLKHNPAIDGNPLEATLDSPDQGAKGIRVEKAEMYGDSVILEVPKLHLTYEGVFQPGDTLIRGCLVQGMKIDLDLVKQQAAVGKHTSWGGRRYHRPQTPVGPFPYDTLECSWTSRGETMHGTLAFPHRRRKSSKIAADGAVVLLGGSGLHDRDETVYGHKPLAVIADALAREGFASLRYDGSPTAAGLADLEADAAAAMNYLKTTCKSPYYGFVGHSLGGNVAMHLASQDPEITDCVMTLCSPVVDGTEMMVTQNLKYIYEKENGLHDSEPLSFWNKREADLRRIFKVIDTETDPAVMRAKLKPLLQDFKHLGADTAQLYAMTSPQFVDIVRMKPGQWLKDIECPVILLYAGEDMQVSSKENHDRWDKLNSKYRLDRERLTVGCRSTARSVYDVNHMLQPVHDPRQRFDYSLQRVTVSEEVLNEILDMLMRAFRWRRGPKFSRSN